MNFYEHLGQSLQNTLKTNSSKKSYGKQAKFDKLMK